MSDQNTFKLPDYINNEVVGYIHKAPNRNFRIPVTVTEMKQSPYVNSVDEKAVETKIILAYSLANDSNIYRVMTTEGFLFTVKVNSLNYDWLKPVVIQPKNKNDEEYLAWFIYDYQYERGLT